jgi:membrane protease YdiL (CAAX protease family)
MTDPHESDDHLRPARSAAPSAGRVTALALAFELGLLAVAVAVAWLLGRTDLTGVTPSARGLMLGVAATFPLVVLLLVLRRSAWRPIVRLRTEVDDHLLPLFRGCTPWQLGVIAVAAGLGEEVLFRGLIQGGLSELAGAAAGLVGASVAFGLVHLITPTYAVMAGAVGLYLGGLAQTAGGIWVPIVTHAAYDFVALVVWVRDASRSDELAQ